MKIFWYKIHLDPDNSLINLNINLRWFNLSLINKLSAHLPHTRYLVVADLRTVSCHDNAEWRGCDRAVCCCHLAACVSIPREQCVPLLFQVCCVHHCIPWVCHSIHSSYAVATKKLQECSVSYVLFFPFMVLDSCYIVTWSNKILWFLNKSLSLNAVAITKLITFSRVISHVSSETA